MEVYHLINGRTFTLGPQAESMFARGEGAGSADRLIFENGELRFRVPSTSIVYIEYINEKKVEEE